MYDAIHVSTLGRTGVKVHHLVSVISERFPHRRDWSRMLGLGLGMRGHAAGAAVISTNIESTPVDNMMPFVDTLNDQQLERK